MIIIIQKISIILCPARMRLQYRTSFCTLSSNLLRYDNLKVKRRARVSSGWHIFQSISNVLLQNLLTLMHPFRSLCFYKLMNHFEYYYILPISIRYILMCISVLLIFRSFSKLKYSGLGTICYWINFFLKVQILININSNDMIATLLYTRDYFKTEKIIQIRSCCLRYNYCRLICHINTTQNTYIRCFLPL
jgi:hypothetical protein